MIIFGRKIELINNFTLKKTMPPITYARFIKFLEEDINLSQDSIAMAQRQVTMSQTSMQHNYGLLPMILWQYGLVNLEQLDQIYDWLETT